MSVRVKPHLRQRGRYWVVSAEEDRSGGGGLVLFGSPVFSEACRYAAMYPDGIRLR